MKFLHTSDWHIGQLFYEFDRTFEHQRFLEWLLQTLVSQQIDVLLISGDVFDNSNPSANSIRLFYQFLNRATSQNPDLQIIITAGNHDSASRLESPKPLLESSKIHIVGIVEKDENGNPDYSKLSIPIRNNQHEIKAWCLAVPFLRLGDYPSIPNSENPYSEGVSSLYKACYEYVITQKDANLPVIALGHLHANQAEITDLDRTERVIMGGVEAISADSFPPDLAYVALGHIHKAQRIGGKEHIRYCGSPIPMSFSELKYKHQVIVFELNSEGLKNLESIEIPVSIPLKRVPEKNKPIEEVVLALQDLPESDEAIEFAPYLEVRVLLDSPEPALRHKIESAIAGKYVRLAKIDVKYPSSNQDGKTGNTISAQDLNELNPSDIFSKVYASKFESAVPELIKNLFNEVLQEVEQGEEA
jgi:DNA repair protein SbcD/Mre11